MHFNFVVALTYSYIVWHAKNYDTVSAVYIYTYYIIYRKNVDKYGEWKK